MSDELIKVDLTEFARSMRRIALNDWPQAVVRGFEQLAERADDDVTAMTRSKFKLNTDYVTRGIRHYPSTEAHRAKAEQALLRYGNVHAAVYLRGSGNPAKSLDFMVDHETGEERKAQKKTLAVPTKTLRGKNYRTGRGRTRRPYKPESLLKRYDEAGSEFANGTTRSPRRTRKKRLPGNAFLIKGRSGSVFIARSVARGKGINAGKLEFLYMFKPKATIKKTWGFEEEVWNSVNKNYAEIFSKNIDRMP